MRTPQLYMLADTFAAAEALDAQVCAFLRVRDGSKGTQWAGVSQRVDGQFGVLYAEDCVAAIGSSLPALDTEIIDLDGGSNWTAFIPPSPSADDL